MKRILFCSLLASAIVLSGLQPASAQLFRWGNNPDYSPTYTNDYVGIGFNNTSMERNLHIRESSSPYWPIGEIPPIENWTAGIRLENLVTWGHGTQSENKWDIFSHPFKAFEIRSVYDNETALYLHGDQKAGLWNAAPLTMLHVGDYRQITMGHTGGDGNGLFGEYIGFNTYLEQHEGSANTISKLASGGPTGGGQSGGSVVATDFTGNLEIQTLNTAKINDAVDDIPYDPQFIFTNQGVLEFRRSEERWTANNWNIHMKAPIATSWVTTTPNTIGEYMGIGMTNSGWYFIRSKNAPGGTDPEVDQCGWYPFYVTLAGKAVAREVEVKIENWCDYVFDDDYDLMPLESVESFIKHHRHLPDIPAEAEVLEEGINLGEMNARLLKKVEELTLYAIDQHNEIEMLKERLNKLEGK